MIFVDPPLAVTGFPLLSHAAPRSLLFPKSSISGGISHRREEVGKSDLCTHNLDRIQPNEQLISVNVMTQKDSQFRVLLYFVRSVVLCLISILVHVAFLRITVSVNSIRVLETVNVTLAFIDKTNCMHLYRW